MLAESSCWKKDRSTGTALSRILKAVRKRFLENCLKWEFRMEGAKITKTMTGKVSHDV